MRPWFLVALGLTACGYHPLRSRLAGNPHIFVARGEAEVPSGAAASLAEEAATAARGELARFGALAAADSAGVDRLVVHVVRLDEWSEGEAPALDGARARGLQVFVTARGEIRGHGDPFETTDMDGSEVVAAPADPLQWQGARAAAERSAARKAGVRVARAVLGVP